MSKRMSPEEAAAVGAGSLLPGGSANYPKGARYTTGRVLSYSADSKKGFVVSKDVEGAIFFHKDSILPNPDSTKVPVLDAGDRVTYLIVPNGYSKGEPHAVHIELIDATGGAAGHDRQDAKAGGSKGDPKKLLSGEIEESETAESS